MNILILSGRFGMGHNSAAKAITGEINNIDSSINVKTVDLLEYLYPGMHEIIYKGFSRIVNKHHELYNIIYKASEKLEMDMKLSSTSINRKMKLLLRENKPDIIISTLPLCARTISAYKEISKIDTPLITCVTDISMHSEWIAPNTDIYFVPTRAIKENLMRKNIREDRIFVIGVPVRREFKEIEHKVKSIDKKNILIMGGGLGLLPDLDVIMDKLEEDSTIKTTIITGSNTKAYDELKGKYKNTEVLGYTDRVSEYMNEADLMISKAGGITLFESIYSHTPMFVIKPFLAQEKANARFIEDNNIGRVVWNKKDFKADSIVDLIYNELELRSMRNNTIFLKNTIVEDDVLDILKNIFKECAA